MSIPQPDALQSLLSTPEGGARERAWTAFLEVHSDLILHVARNQGGDHDAAMDRYLFIIQALRENDCRRLRAYTVDGGGKFSTWLLVVARRLCFDQHRARYGRPQSETDAATAQQQERRQLVDLVGSELQLELLESQPEKGPEAECRRRELRAALERALAELSPRERLLVRLRFEDGASVPEIARLMKEGSPFAMYRQLDKLLARLRRSLHASGVEDPAP
jgi:RNA polymerase sigma factor (sigma-70 family)